MRPSLTKPVQRRGGFLMLLDRTGSMCWAGLATSADAEPLVPWQAFLSLNGRGFSVSNLPASFIPSTTGSRIMVTH
jgi:hypothetical protein